MVRDEKTLLARVEELFKSNGYLTPWDIARSLGINLSDARKVFTEFKKYCVSKGMCIEVKGILYNIIETRSLKELEEARIKLISKKGLEQIIYLILKDSGKCMTLEEIYQQLIRKRVKIPTPYILEAISRLYKVGLIIEKRPLCFQAV